MMRALLRSSALVLVLTALKCPDKGPDFFGPGLNSPQTGNLGGTVLFGSTPLAGASVVLSTTPTISVTTPANGTFNFNDLNIGSYSLTTTLNGYTCPMQTAVVELDKTVNVNVPCTPVPGTVAGTVTVAGSPRAGLKVSLIQNGAEKFTAQTGANGTYAMSSIPPGSYAITVAEPSNTTCSNNGRSITVVSGQTTTQNFDCTSTVGTVSGTVTVNGQVAAGVSVTLRNETRNVTIQTQIDGTFTFISVDPGTYTVSITPLSGTSCTADERTATVTAGQTTFVNFSCSALPGTISGQVSGLPSGQTATLTLKTTDGATVSTAATNSSGSYSMINLPPGRYEIFISVSPALQCSPVERSVDVTAAENTIVNFICDTFIVVLDGSYRHVVAGVSSETCVKISTVAPKVPGASWSVTWTGPGVVAPATRSGVLDANGEAFDRQPINLIGTYTATVTVIQSGVTVIKAVNVPVTSADGTCAAPPP